MWKLVGAQIKSSHQALQTVDKNLARDIIVNEKTVNEMELKIDRHCENIFALFHPVAVDLRFVLAVLKINSNLERTGDIAEGIAKFILNTEKIFEQELIDIAQVEVMYEEVGKIMEDGLTAFINEDTKIARGLFQRDELLNKINLNANSIISDFIRINPDKIEQGLYILSTIRKLERIGDQCKNISEELIFYVEAKVLKHGAK